MRGGDIALAILACAMCGGCGARTELAAGGQGGASPTPVTSTASTTTTTTSASSSSSSSSSNSSSGAGGGCTTDADCGCGLNCCNGRCVNEANDINNCGGCGMACANALGLALYCNNGTCAGPPCGIKDCGGTCCADECCSPGQLCCAVNVAITTIKCQEPTAAGTCDVGAPCTVCASPDTPIASPEGERAIAALQVGDLVYSVENEAVVVVPVLKASRREVPQGHRVVEVVLASGAVLRISPRHPTADGRLFADLVPGDHLGEVEVVSAKLVPYDGEFTYDILPATSAGFYFAGGALVGSTITGK